MDHNEMKALWEEAIRHGMTVSEWVRHSLRNTGGELSSLERGRKLAAVRAASRYAFPTADIDGMLAQIGRGYAAR